MWLCVCDTVIILFFCLSPIEFSWSDWIMSQSGWDKFTQSGFLHHLIRSEPKIFQIGLGRIGSDKIFCLLRLFMHGGTFPTFGPMTKMSVWWGTYIYWGLGIAVILALFRAFVGDRAAVGCIEGMHLTSLLVPRSCSQNIEVNELSTIYCVTLV